MSLQAERNLGAVTFNVIEDKLVDYAILNKPKNMSHVLKWCVVPGSQTEMPFCQASQILYLVRPASVRDVVQTTTAPYMLLVLHADEPFTPERYGLSHDNLLRTLVVRANVTEASFSLIQSELSGLFFTAFTWENKCMEIVRTGGSIQDLVDYTELYIKNWINVTDGTYSLIARTHSVEPPDALSQSLVKLGCHSSDNIFAAKTLGAVKEWQTQNTVTLFEASELVPYPHITAILRLGSEYYGHAVMVCNDVEATPGVVDIFRRFTDFCQQIFERDSRKNTDVFAPYQNFIENLISDKPLSRDYINSQLETLQLGTCSFFRLVTIDYHQSEYSYQPPFLMSVVKKIIPNALSILYRGDIVVLFCGNESMSDFATGFHEKLERFCEKYQCICYKSGFAYDICDVPLLYKQASIALQYSSCIQSERLPLDPDAKIYSYLYEDAFNYYCCDFGRKDDRFLVFCLNHSLLDYMLNEKSEKDVSDIKLLYCFLCNDRKASPTAELLHMHRNNVLYRIEAIEKRYHIDLNRHGLRQYFLTCYRIKIQNSAAFRKLLNS